jgi:hypothetical protein
MIKSSGANPYHAGNICRVCRCLKPERTSHCRRCDLCIPRMDHHCPSLETCVHYTNHKQFLLLFFWTAVTSAFFASISVPYYRKAVSQMPDYELWSPPFWISVAYYVFVSYFLNLIILSFIGSIHESLSSNYFNNSAVHYRSVPCKYFLSRKLSRLFSSLYFSALFGLFCCFFVADAISLVWTIYDRYKLKIDGCAVR